MEITNITSKPDSLSVYLRRTWENRSVIYALASRDIKVRYAQTLFGILWALVQPLIGLLIFTFFFSNIFGIDTGAMPYPLFVFCGMISWFLFTFIVIQGGQSLSENQQLIDSLNVPKIIYPLSKVLVGLFEFGLSLIVLTAMMVIMGHLPGLEILLLPLVVLYICTCGIAIALWLSALTIRFKDLNHLIPYLVNFAIWITPVFYPISILPESVSKYIFLNPMASAVELCRWSLMEGQIPTNHHLISFAMIIILLLSGLLYFKEVESKAADFK